MAYDEQLAQRIRGILDACEVSPDIVEKKMFGGLAFMLRGNMCVGVHGDGMIVRVDPAEHEALLGRPHVRVFDLSGRPMAGWLVVEAGGLKTRRQLESWIARGQAFASSLPPK